MGIEKRFKKVNCFSILDVLVEDMPDPTTEKKIWTTIPFSSLGKTETYLECIRALLSDIQSKMAHEEDKKQICRIHNQLKTDGLYLSGQLECGLYYL